jgi:hypothetical protein
MYASYVYKIDVQGMAVITGAAALFRSRFVHKKVPRRCPAHCKHTFFRLDHIQALDGLPLPPV